MKALVTISASALAKGMDYLFSGYGLVFDLSVLRTMYEHAVVQLMQYRYLLFRIFTR